MKLSKHAGRRIVTTAAVAAVVPASALMAYAASAATPSPQPSKVAIAQGTGPAALQNAAAFGTTPASTPESVSFVLRGQNLSGLASAVEAGHSPDLSVAQFAKRYGQDPAVISALEKYLKGFGITVTQTYSDGLDVSTTGTAGEYDSALSVQQQQYHVPAVRAHDGSGGIPAQTIHGTKQTPMLPGSFGRGVLAVLGLSNYSPFTDRLTHVPSAVRSSTSATPTTTYTGNLTPSDFASNYGLNPLYKDGMTGAGQTIGIVTLAGFDPATAEYFWNNVLHISTAANRLSVDNVDGGPGAPDEQAGSGESDLDVEQSGALAPDAGIVVYQAPNTDPGFADAMFTAASANAAGTVSSSWGESETVLKAGVASGQETAAYGQAFDEAFLEMAAQDQSMFTSAGDSGAYDASGDLGTTNLSVDTPADSPFVTAAGGTTLGGKISATVVPSSGPTVNVSATIPAQRAWGWDWLWQDYAAFGAPSESAFAVTQIGGGGGGYSTSEATPSYQYGVGAQLFHAVQYLTPTANQTVDNLTLPTSWNFNPTPSVQSGYGTGRAVPDLSADADPFTGYLLYDPLSSVPLQAGWGGTSFVAPQLNGSAALINEYVGHRVGLWNPAIYRLAQGKSSPFTPLDASGTSNDNLYYTGTPGHIYNVGTGLGYPNLAKLATDLAR
ncbi:MAG TPA: S53 family peptidase [Streptosporangiaceae bacterium]